MIGSYELFRNFKLDDSLNGIFQGVISYGNIDGS